jgi:membrane-associated protease RseP (regulator of RpoE activity)
MNNAALPLSTLAAPQFLDLVARVRPILAPDLSINSVKAPREPQEGALILHGQLTTASHLAFPRWLVELRLLGYTPMLRPDPDPPADQAENAVIVYLMPGVPEVRKPRPWINLVLFLLTVVSTLFVGMLYSGNLDGINGAGDLFRPSVLLRGLPFSATILSILLAHEFGHYFTARYHKIAVSLPFFIPMPTILGTLGAVIVQREPFPDRRKLFDIGVAGPLAGLVIAIPLLIIGLATSPVAVMPPMPGAQLEGNSILYFFTKLAIFGKPLPNPVTGEDVFLNQMALAAWAGLLVTALNLLPVSQLDGGHTVYALFGNAARYVNMTVIGLLGLFAVAGIPQVQTIFPALREVGYLGWFIWIGLILFLLTPFHPPALDDVTQLDRRRRIVGYVVIAIFILTFVPTPMRTL